MNGLEVLSTILFAVLLLAYLYILWRKHRTLWKTLVLSLAIVLFETSIWHVVFGEDFAALQCPGVDYDAILGFTHCSAWTVGYLFDTYEVTVSTVGVVLAGLVFIYVRPKQILQFTMLCLIIVTSVLLTFLPYNILKDYVMPYNIVAALLSLTIVVDELYDYGVQEYTKIEEIEV